MTRERSQLLPIEKDLDQTFYRGFESFLCNLFSNDFGYTLVGAKPISYEELPRENMHEIDARYFKILEKMFEQSSNFVLKILDRGDLFHPCIELIHKKALRAAVAQNSRVRSFVKAEFQTEANLFSRLEDPHQSIFQIIKDERVLGCLLGYSTANIEYYFRRMKIGRYLQKYPLYRFHPLPGGKYSGNSFCWNLRPYYERINPSKGFKSLEAEWQWIQEVEWNLERETFPPPPYFVSLPLYICCRGGDSESSRERFKRASYKIAELFYKKSFQEAISEEALKHNHKLEST